MGHAERTLRRKFGREDYRRLFSVLLRRGQIAAVEARFTQNALKFSVILIGGALSYFDGGYCMPVECPLLAARRTRRVNGGEEAELNRIH
jgi:hypothetical protein